TTFSIPVTNKGPDYGGGDSFTITGPGGFKETGKIPKIGAGGNITLTHAAKAKLGDGIFTVTLNIKDSNPANNTAVVKHKTVVPSPSLAIVSITRDGKMVKITLKNEGTGDYATGGGVVFKLVHQLPKGGSKNLPEPAIPNIAAGATVSFQVPDPGVGALT